MYIYIFAYDGNHDDDDDGYGDDDVDCVGDDDGDGMDDDDEYADGNEFR